MACCSWQHSRVSLEHKEEVVRNSNPGSGIIRILELQSSPEVGEPIDEEVQDAAAWPRGRVQGDVDVLVLA
jgi:hypothetical protein